MATETILQEITIRVPGRPPTANARRHWRSVARDNETWKNSTTHTAEQAKHEWEARHGLKWRPLRLADLTVVFGVHTRAVRDWDNLIGSIKPELDGIVAAGILLDDSIRVIRSISFAIAQSPREPYTEFVASEVIE